LQSVIDCKRIIFRNCKRGKSKSIHHGITYFCVQEWLHLHACMMMVDRLQNEQQDADGSCSFRKLFSSWSPRKSNHSNTEPTGTFDHCRSMSTGRTVEIDPQLFLSDFSLAFAGMFPSAFPCSTATPVP
ncbi:hypothetical protein T12_13305, partial [Trichinella patagoniensis]